MNSLHIFFNSTLDLTEHSCISSDVSYCNEKSVRIHKSASFTSAMNNLGNSFLYPVRCLFNGDQIKINKIVEDSLDLDLNIVIRTRVTEEWDNTSESLVSNKNFINVALSILFLAPGIILGTVCKSIAYISSSKLREMHNFALKYYDSYMRGTIILGDDAHRVDQERIRKNICLLPGLLRSFSLKNEASFFDRNYQYNALIIYSKKGETISKSIGLSDENFVDSKDWIKNLEGKTLATLTNFISKIILVGAKLSTPASFSGDDEDSIHRDIKSNRSDRVDWTQIKHEIGEYWVVENGKNCRKYEIIPKNGSSKRFDRTLYRSFFEPKQVTKIEDALAEPCYQKKSEWEGKFYTIDQ